MATVDFTTDPIQVVGPDQTLAIAQVVYTVTQQPGVTGVTFEIAGKAIEVPDRRRGPGARPGRPGRLRCPRHRSPDAAARPAGPVRARAGGQAAAAQATRGASFHRCSRS